MNEKELIKILKQSRGRIPVNSEFLKWKKDRKEKINDKILSSKEYKKKIKSEEIVSTIPIEGIRVKVGHSEKSKRGIIKCYSLVIGKLNVKPKIVLVILRDDNTLQEYSINCRFSPIGLELEDKSEFYLNINKLREIDSYIKKIHKEAILWNDFLKTKKKTGNPPLSLDDFMSPYYVRDNNGSIVEKINIESYLTRFKNFKSWNYSRELFAGFS